MDAAGEGGVSMRRSDGRIARAMLQGVKLGSRVQGKILVAMSGTLLFDVVHRWSSNYDLAVTSGHRVS